MLVSEVNTLTRNNYFPTGAGAFSLCHRVQARSRVSSAYPVGTVGSCLGGRAAGAWRWPLTSN